VKAWFLRHGESTYNVQGLCNDDPARPVPLTARGRRQAEAAADTLRDAPLERIFTSALPRCRETAAILDRHHGVPVVVDGRLNDIRTGFDGRPVAEYFAATGQDRWQVAAPGGETLAAYAERVTGFLAWLEAQAFAAVAVVAHEETLRVVAARYRGLDRRAMEQVQAENAVPELFVLPAGP
jgi:broad specificity phosphatase PhoE